MRLIDTVSLWTVISPWICSSSKYDKTVLTVMLEILYCCIFKDPGLWPSKSLKSIDSAFLELTASAYVDGEFTIMSIFHLTTRIVKNNTFLYSNLRKFTGLYICRGHRPNIQPCDDIQYWEMKACIWKPALLLFYSVYNKLVSQFPFFFNSNFLLVLFHWIKLFWDAR